MNNNQKSIPKMDMDKQKEQVETVQSPSPENDKMDQATLPRTSKELSSSSAKMIDNHTMTLSTKMSTDRLICKSPRDSPAGSFIDKKGKQILTPNRVLMALSILQFILGFLMVLFGMYVIAYKASLSQIGGGIWGGIIAMVTGIAGTLAAAKNVCPFKTTAEKVAQTTFLAMSLISLAVSQLIVVIAATGLARDVNSTSFQEAMQKNDDMSNFGKFSMEISENYKGILYNIILVTVASLECIVAAIASYKSSREVCPCFKRSDEYYQDNLNMHRSHALVSSWLMGKHSTSVSSPTPIYVVTGPNSSLGRGSKLSTGMPIPVYAIPTPVVQPQIVGYPLIPAPLGPVPSPIIMPPNRKAMKVQKRYKSRSKSKSRSREPTPRRSRSKSSTKESPNPQISQEDLVQTYTGLDRAIAEEFIDICEMKNASLCSDVSCNDSSCQSPSGSTAGCHTNSDTNSHDCLVNK